MQERSKIKQFFFGEIDDYGLWLIGLFLLTFFSPLLSRYLIDIDLLAISFGIYSIVYFQRFGSKTYNLWNLFKMIYTIGLLLIIIDYSYFYLLNDTMLFVGYLSLFTLYFIDRILLKTMKKFTLVLNVILVLVSVFFIVYARIQVNLAKEQTELAEQNAVKAELNMRFAMEEAAKAKEAELNAIESLKELEECKKQNQ
jgi:hypothetical protein